MTHGEVEITAELVRDLVREQHPDLADRPVRLRARGWDNQPWRLGDDLAVRLPWATGSADALLRKEYSWIPMLAPRLPLAVPSVSRTNDSSQYRKPVPGGNRPMNININHLPMTGRLRLGPASGRLGS